MVDPLECGLKGYDPNSQVSGKKSLETFVLVRGRLAQHLASPMTIFSYCYDVLSLYKGEESVLSQWRRGNEEVYDLHSGKVICVPGG